MKVDFESKNSSRLEHLRPGQVFCIFGLSKILMKIQDIHCTSESSETIMTVDLLTGEYQTFSSDLICNVLNATLKITDFLSSEGNSYVNVSNDN